MQDYRIGQKVIALIKLEDKWQDFVELDVLENGVLLGDSGIFKDGRLSLLGLGTGDGMDYWSFKDLKADKEVVARGVLLAQENVLVYIYETGTKEPLPWKANTLKYKVESVLEAKDADRFVR